VSSDQQTTSDVQISSPARPNGSAVSRRLRLARMGVLLIFFVNGATFASLVPRYPEIIARLDVSNTLWGLALGVGPVGGIVLGWLAAPLMRRFRSRNVAAAAQLASSAALIVVANAGSIEWIFVAMFVMNAFDAVTDTSMNYHGLRVQRLYRRSIFNSFHGWWCIGGVVGGFLGSTAAGAGMSVPTQGVVTLVVLVVCVAASWAMMLPGRDREPVSEAQAVSRTAWLNARTIGVLVGLGLLGALAGGVELGGSVWSPGFMVAQFSATPFVAGLGFVALMLAETAGRLTGDRLVDRLGQVSTVALGAVICAAGMGLAVAMPSVVMSLVGFAAAGWGVATMIPAAMTAADRLPGVPAGVGLTVTAWVMRLGLIAFPIAMGAIGDAVSLRWALLVIPVSAVLILALSPLLKPRAEQSAVS
jgi:MFS family permease